MNTEFMAQSLVIAGASIFLILGIFHGVLTPSYSNSNMTVVSLLVARIAQIGDAAPSA
jgi:hypothetical protein